MSVIQEVISAITSWISGFMNAILDVIEGLFLYFIMRMVWLCWVRLV